MLISFLSYYAALILSHVPARLIHPGHCAGARPSEASVPEAAHAVSPGSRPRSASGSRGRARRRRRPPCALRRLRRRSQLSLRAPAGPARACSLAAQRPRLLPHRPASAARLSRACAQMPGAACEPRNAPARSAAYAARPHAASPWPRFCPHAHPPRRPIRTYYTAGRYLYVVLATP